MTEIQTREVCGECGGSGRSPRGPDDKDPLYLPAPAYENSFCPKCKSGYIYEWVSLNELLSGGV